MENVGWMESRKSVKHSVENDRKQPKIGLKRLYSVFTSCSLIPYPVRHLELSTNKGIKNVRETSDIVGSGSTNV